MGVTPRMRAEAAVGAEHAPRGSLTSRKKAAGLQRSWAHRLCIVDLNAARHGTTAKARNAEAVGWECIAILSCMAGRWS